ncbi:MAG: hypothetical protein GY934_23540, partial [Gammaproteobacteria bacterium]|nr:hypothetical protein [Gammaproteobacteria bacterium]
MELQHNPGHSKSEADWWNHAASLGLADVSDLDARIRALEESLAGVRADAEAAMCQLAIDEPSKLPDGSTRSKTMSEVATTTNATALQVANFDPEEPSVRLGCGPSHAQVTKTMKVRPEEPLKRSEPCASKSASEQVMVPDNRSRELFQVPPSTQLLDFTALEADWLAGGPTGPPAADLLGSAEAEGERLPLLSATEDQFKYPETADDEWQNLDEDALVDKVVSEGGSYYCSISALM